MAYCWQQYMLAHNWQSRPNTNSNANGTNENQFIRMTRTLNMNGPMGCREEKQHFQFMQLEVCQIYQMINGWTRKNCYTQHNAHTHKTKEGKNSCIARETNGDISGKCCNTNDIISIRKNTYKTHTEHDNTHIALTHLAFYIGWIINLTQRHINIRQINSSLFEWFFWLCLLISNFEVCPEIDLLQQ